MVVRRWQECLIDQEGEEEVALFVVKCGKPGVSCSGGHLDYIGVWGVGTLVVGRS